MQAASLISCHSISKVYGTQTLFSDLSIGFFEGECLGLIGPNGSGKTTLLKMLAGVVTPSSGRVSRRRNLHWVYLAQDAPLDSEKSVQEILFEDMPEMAERWVSQQEIRRLVTALAFEDLHQQVATLSGGWRKRLSIARALIQKPDILFMDEPTNHLDLDGILWLEQRLQTADFAFVLVSHDRIFLEHTANRIVELNRCYPEGYLRVEGNYSTFLSRRAEFLNAQSREEQALASKVRRELAWLRRGPKARTTKAQFRIDQAGRLQNDLSALKTRNGRQQSAQFAFDSTDRKTKILLETKGLKMSRAGKVLFQNLDLMLSPGFRLGLLGANGSGKSTLLHLLNGDLQPDAGKIKKAEHLRIVTFAQQREQLNPNQTVQEALAPEGGDQVIYQGRPIHIVSWAKRFLFTAHQLGLPVSRLSGGEQARLLIAHLMLKPADLLLLDEPSNDLDIPTLEVLEESLDAFPGAIVLITHDRYLLERLSDVLLVLEGDGRTAFYADLAQWRQAQGNKTLPQAVFVSSLPQKKDKTEAGRKLNFEERKELKRIEKKIEKAEAKLEAAKQALHDPDIQSDADELLARSNTLQETEADVASLYARWEDLENRNV